MKASVFFYLLAAAAIIAGVGFQFFRYGQACGGIAANTPRFQCKPPLKCVVQERHPDTQGHCQFSYIF